MSDEVLQAWARDGEELGAAILDLSQFRRRYKNKSCAPRIRSYEDLVENKEQSLDRLARFLGSGRELGEDMRARIAASTGFESMKQEMTVNPRSFYFNPKVFFRSGKAREWAEQLTAEQIARIDEKTRRVWGGTDLRCPPEALIG